MVLDCEQTILSKDLFLAKKGVQSQILVVVQDAETILSVWELNFDLIAWEIFIWSEFLMTAVYNACADRGKHS